MDQRPGELEQNEEAISKRDEDSQTGVTTVSPADSTDTLESEQDVKQDMEKLDSDSGDSTEEPEQIKEQIEQTRSHMSETIGAIQEKLSFSNLSEQVSEQINNAVVTAKDAVYDATIGRAENIMQNVSKGFSNVSESMGDAGSYVVSSAKRNPLPLALIGAGIGLLVFQGSRRKSNHKRNRYDSNRYELSDRHADEQEESRIRSESNVRGGSGMLSNVQKRAGDVAGSAYEGVSNAASSAYGGVSSLASSTGEQVQHVARRAQRQYENTLDENPLAIGAVALALGAIVGLAIPSTDYENEWMGETKENLVQSVEGVARDAFSKVQQVAGDVTKTVSEQVQKSDIGSVGNQKPKL